MSDAISYSKEDEIKMLQAFATKVHKDPTPERTTSGPIQFAGMNPELSAVNGLIMPYYNQVYLEEIQGFLDFIHSKQEGS